jgi:hypothetical protein
VEGSDELYGYGTWKFRDVKLADAQDPISVIDIPYFGVQHRFHGETDTDGRKLARRFYATVEEVARLHPDATDEMPMHLVCDVNNARAQAFWHGLGFIDVEPLQYDDVAYTRMMRR